MLLDVDRLERITVVSKLAVVSLTGNICGCLKKGQRNCEFCLWPTMVLVKNLIKMLSVPVYVSLSYRSYISG